jgi:tryptophanase
MERDMAEIEFPKRPSMLDDILRRSLTDNYRSRRDGTEPVRHVAVDDGAGGEFDTGNRYEVAMNTGTNINLRRLQEQLDRQPLDEIAMLVRALTYGEMIELAESMWNVKPDNSELNEDNLPAVLYRWSTSRQS